MNVKNGVKLERCRVMIGEEGIRNLIICITEKERTKLDNDDRYFVVRDGRNIVGRLCQSHWSAPIIGRCRCTPGIIQGKHPAELVVGEMHKFSTVKSVIVIKIANKGLIGAKSRMGI
jgi:hypothetical protein